jgi:hypothetical protein
MDGKPERPFCDAPATHASGNRRNHEREGPLLFLNLDCRRGRRRGDGILRAQGA